MFASQTKDRTLESSQEKPVNQQGALKCPLLWTASAVVGVILNRPLCVLYGTCCKQNAFRHQHESVPPLVRNPQTMTLLVLDGSDLQVGMAPARPLSNWNNSNRSNTSLVSSSLNKSELRARACSTHLWPANRCLDVAGELMFLCTLAENYSLETREVKRQAEKCFFKTERPYRSTEGTRTFNWQPFKKCLWQ